MVKLLQHKHLIIRAEVETPPLIEESMSEWMSSVVEAIEMQILDGPRTIYSDMKGNRGMTSSVILNTSHFCVHTWDEVWPAIMQVDVYSCGDLKPLDIINLLGIFDPVKIEYKFLDRETSLKLIESNI